MIDALAMTEKPWRPRETFFFARYDQPSAATSQAVRRWARQTSPTAFQVARNRPFVFIRPAILRERPAGWRHLAGLQRLPRWLVPQPGRLIPWPRRVNFTITPEYGWRPAYGAPRLVFGLIISST